MSPAVRLKRLWLSAAFTLIAVGCGDDQPMDLDPVPGPPDALVAIAGDAQSASAGTALSTPLTVKLSDVAGLGIPGQQISYVVTSGGGSVFVPSVFTDENGEARNEWVLGPSVAELQRVEARAIDAGTGRTFAATFEATALTGPAATLRVVSGSGQAALAGGVLPDSLVVRVEDALGNPIAGVAVAWGVTAGDGSIDMAEDTTGAEGLAVAAWTIGSQAAVQQSVTASAGALSDAVFDAWVCTQLWSVDPGCFYPRVGAPSVGDFFSPSPALPLQAGSGSTVGVFDLTGRGDNTFDETLAAVRALEPLGIPWEIFTDALDATDYEFVQLAGTIRAGDLSGPEIGALTAYVNGGGVLFLHNVADPALYSLAGIAGDSFAPLHSELTFLDSGDALMTYLDHPLERTVPFGDGVVQVIAREYVCSSSVLAEYEDGSDAVCRNDLGSGTVYTFGLRPKTLQLLRQIGRTGGLEVSFTNRFNPVGDLPSLVVRGIYEARASDPELRNFAPPGRAGVLVVTHDIDASSSIANLPDYQGFELQQGISATYFVQTPGHSTGYTAGFYTPAAVDLLKVWRTNFDIGSHSFGHFEDLDECPLGSGDESAATYLPLFVSGSSVGCTVFGEAGVSRYLLQTDLGVAAESFRSGGLVRPPELPAVLYALGYRRSSILPSGFAGVGFPFVSFTFENPVVTEYSVMEYPLSLSDAGLDETTVASTVAAWEAVLEANAANGVPTVLLVHPSNRPGRLDAFRQFIESVNDGTYWITDLQSFADFWEGQGVLRIRP